MNEKTKRQELLIEIIKSENIFTQIDLVKYLEKDGYKCTQASVSRDIRDLGLVKKEGKYIVPFNSMEISDIEELREAVSRFLRQIEVCGDHLVVVKTMSGTAHSVGLLLDRVNWPGLAGTIAGDDTIFVASRNKIASQRISRNIRKMLKQR